MANKRFLAILASLAAGAAISTFGRQDHRVGFSSVLRLFTDAARDADQAGMRATRLSDSEETAIGASLAAQFAARENPALTAYVSDVGSEVARDVRRKGIHYTFHVIDDPAVNAFALPGGQIVVMSGMLDFAESEAELAAVLGHEVAHVDLRHCVERYQLQTRFGTLAELAHRLATFPFQPYQESSADLRGFELAAAAHYDPSAGRALFLRMKSAFNEPGRPRANTPAGEAAVSIRATLTDFLRSHPPSDDRARTLDTLLNAQKDRLRGQAFYVGKRNLVERVAASRQAFAEEYRAY